MTNMCGWSQSKCAHAAEALATTDVNLAYAIYVELRMQRKQLRTKENSGIGHPCRGLLTCNPLCASTLGDTFMIQALRNLTHHEHKHEHEHERMIMKNRLNLCTTSRPLPPMFLPPQYQG